MFSDKAKGLRRYVIIFLITLLLVLFIRSFFVQSYTISSSQMETAMIRGDRVFVDKTAYGTRMPVTLLSLPFTFDQFLGFKSYSDLIQLGYYRLSERSVKRNDIVLFNNPLETDKPLDKRSLMLSRCVATSGDTIQVQGGDFFINDKKYIPSPDLLLSFRFKKEKHDSIASVMSFFDIPVRNITQDSIWGYVSLNRYEVFILNQQLPEDCQLETSNEREESYRLLIPSKGMLVELNQLNVELYGSLILQEAAKEDNIKLENYQITKDGVPLKFYEFNENYYWFISDNSDEAVDSRTLGFISEKYIIGKASVIWFSYDKSSVRWDRIFSLVK